MSKVVDWSGVTPGQIKDFFRQIQDGSLTEEQIKNFLAHRNPFRENELPYADEEVASSYTYPAGFGIKTVAKQIYILKKHFPSLDSSFVERFANPQMQSFLDMQARAFPGAERFGVIPKPSMLGNYNVATEQVLALLAKQRKFKNWRERQLGLEYLRLVNRTETALRLLDQSTPGDFLLFPFQFGLKHRGRSIRRARVCMPEMEWGLGPFEVGSLLLTHSERITGREQLYIDCAGVEYCSEGDSASFWASLSFIWDYDDGCLEFDSSSVDDAYQDFGSVSGFGPVLPQR